MSTHNPHHRAVSSGAATAIMLSVMLAAAASGALASRDDAGAFPVRAALAAPADLSGHWTPAEIRQLMAVIEESEKAGFDPQNYGLAALRSELDQSTELSSRAGSRQLDVLASTAALALANDYRERAHVRLASDEDVKGALASGQLRAWLTLRKD